MPDNEAPDNAAPDNAAPDNAAPDVELSTERVAIEEVLHGLQIHQLEDGEVPVEAFILLKVRDRDGDIGWSYRTTRAPNREEILGALMIQVDILRAELRADWD